MNNHGPWRIGALASAIALLGSLASLQAHALALGRITVQSALGEPLRAEIDMSDIDAEEASSLRVGVAPAEAFKAAGLEYSAAVTGLEIRLQRRADGRSYLRLSSNRAMTEPFVDLILETSGSAGRITRDYTMLFDPPKLRANANSLEPVIASVPRIQVPASNAYTPDSRELPPTARAAPLARAAAPRTRPADAPPLPIGTRQVVVQPGDTASRIAARNKPVGVSLDEMLAALLKNNPSAFVAGNINVIKSGAVLDIPGQDVAASLPGEARTVATESKDFNAFRRKLAEGAPSAQVTDAQRRVSGKVQTTVEDRASKIATPDKLTLSSGAVQAGAAPGTAPEVALGGVSSVPAAAMNGSTGIAAAGGTVAAGRGAAVPGAELAATAAALPASSTTNGIAAPLTSVSGPAASASTAAVPALARKSAVAAAAPAQAGLLEEAADNPLVLVGAGGLLLLLAGLAFARYRRNKKAASGDSSFLESRLQLDSFFGASGGQHIDTRASSAAATSTTYTLSQLDHAGDVDPVAEADVYLAYGRDQQAEEILKEALRNHPERLALHAKLVEIYARRRDSKAFDSTALEAYQLTKGSGPEWSHIAKLGRDLNPGNSLYRLQAEPAGGASTPGMPANTAASAADKPPMATAAVAPADTSAPDLDFSLNEAPLPKFSTSGLGTPSSLGTPSAFLQELDLDLDLDIDSAPAPLTASSHAPLSASPPANASSSAADFPADKLDFKPETLMARPAPPARSEEGLEPPAHSGMLEFDMSALSLDLGPTTQAPTLEPAGAPEDPLEIKFLLAEEFRILGDSAGARSLADEVLVKARGPLKAKAQAFLNTLP